jgi:putative addiction module component (TIGR02574 family)
MSNLNTLVDTVLALPAASRALLAEKLLESLDAGTRAEIDAAWAEEFDRRVQEFDEGKVKGISADEVFAAIRARKKP